MNAGMTKALSMLESAWICSSHTVMNTSCMLVRHATSSHSQEVLSRLFPTVLTCQCGLTHAKLVLLTNKDHLLSTQVSKMMMVLETLRPN